MEKTRFSEYLKSSYEIHNGEPLDKEVRDYLRREIFPSVVPQGWKQTGAEEPVYTNLGTQVASGYEAIVGNEYGIYLVVSQEHLIRKNVQQVVNESESRTGAAANTVLYKSSDGEMVLSFQVQQAGKNSFPAGYYYINIFDAAAGKPLPVIHAASISEPYTLFCQPISCRGVYFDGISPTISKKWPAICNEYQKICAENEPLSLLGQYQVFTIDADGTRGIVNLFCTQAVSEEKKYAGLNIAAMGNALFSLCNDAPNFKIIIPYHIGCTTQEEWDTVSLMLNCRLRGTNAVMVVPEKKETPVEEAVPVQEVKTKVVKKQTRKTVKKPVAAVKSQTQEPRGKGEKPKEKKRMGLMAVFSKGKAPKQEEQKPEPKEIPALPGRVAPASKYLPQLVDISKVVLNPDMKQLSEHIARNAHEFWAAGRFTAGWEYGPVMDQTSKQHPALVPYDHLGEDEKNVWRDIAAKSLKALLAQGYKIT